ncbi:cytochrome c [Sulfitobacter sp. D35]|uniref:c-type cytochrome n=1 Tax=Sulfitobacter sp. D35 TaxID=3083252 RepID=UPI00296F1814|nr:cytochrome c [Sulfitobacter sp. D35]MDW4497779.1 cytochrome c [Sulfitobacter sp. D35]
MPRTPALATAALIAAAIGAAGIASAQDKAPPSVKARNHLMHVNGFAMGILGGMAKGEVEYDAALAASAAQNMHAMAMLDVVALWPEGTEQGAAKTSRSKAEIWSDMDGFKAGFDSMREATATLVEAAGTDLETLRGAMGPVGKSCGDCHETYRGPKDK